MAVEGRSDAAGGAARSGDGGPRVHSPPEKIRYGGFSNKCFCTKHRLRSGDSIRVLALPLP
jgi:hypothetical protein